MIETVRDVIARALRHPIAFMLAVNVVCAVLGLLQFTITLAWLQPTDFARLGILVAIAALVTGLLDVRLVDLTTRLYYARPADDATGRCNLLRASLALHTLQAIVSGVSIALSAALLASWLSESRFEAWWIVVVAARAGSSFVVNILASFLRLAAAFQAAGWLRLAGQVVATVATFIGFWISPDLDGYFIGMAITTITTPILTIGVAAPLIDRAHGARLLRLPSRPAVREFSQSTRFLAAGSLTGFSKLLSRSCDLLLVAALTDDTTTGLYRVARQGYDTLLGLSDAVHQFYTPTIVDAANRGRQHDVERHTARLMAIGALVAAGAISFSWIALRPLAAARYPQYAAVLPAFEVMASLLVVSLGVHGWLWPLLIARGGAARFGVWSLLGAMAQLAAIAILGHVGLLDVTTAAMTGWVTALVTYVPLLLRRRRSGSQT